MSAASYYCDETSDCISEDGTEEDGTEEDGNLEDDLALHASMQRSDALAATWEVFDAKSLERLQSDALGEVIAILNCSTSTARLLLMHFRWDKGSLFEAMAERGMEPIFRAARVISQFSSDLRKLPSGGETLCGICFSQQPASEVTTMECGHCFCDDCWKTHFRIQIDGGNCRLLGCMAEDCGAVCDDARVKALIADQPALWWRYCHTLLHSYVDDGKFVKWCPAAPHCGRAIKVIDGDAVYEPVCGCGHHFCFSCLDCAHSPCSCHIWRLWLDKTSNDTETKHWVSANTKPCPKCKSNVEKISGCNLVTCRCGQHFCWLCGGATGLSHTFTSITGHTCGRFKDESDARIEGAQRNLKRFQHYQSRWEGHVESSRLEQKMTEKLLAEISDMQCAPHPAANRCSLTAPVVDFGWLTQAVQQLEVARRTLGFSYVAAFFMFDGITFKDDILPEQSRQLCDLFEDAQGMLEEEVERLSKHIEAPAHGHFDGHCVSQYSDDDATETSPLDYRQRVINSSVNIHNRLNKLYEFIEDEILVLLSSTSCSIAAYQGGCTKSRKVVEVAPS